MTSNPPCDMQAGASEVSCGGGGGEVASVIAAAEQAVSEDAEG